MGRLFACRLSTRSPVVSIVPSRLQSRRGVCGLCKLAEREKCITCVRLCECSHVCCNRGRWLLASPVNFQPIFSEEELRSCALVSSLVKSSEQLAGKPVGVRVTAAVPSRSGVPFVRASATGLTCEL